MREGDTVNVFDRAVAAVAPVHAAKLSTRSASHTGVSAQRANSRTICACSFSASSGVSPRNSASICGAGISPPAITFVRMVFSAALAVGIPM